ncbi:hypothetical protein BMF94_4851 [Rhodotorula taiwanensis]|uniref:F-box domain-containing protein n=1 Tax=Rhodotorula taiwanensis TaxID=741276 RepID=A0A2S5B5R6_9BASI|nr:hypothetical protein BMF94_4851 [Rhodotorula taiwanensis]
MAANALAAALARAPTSPSSLAAAACRRCWTILKPLRWKVLAIDTSTADFARLNIFLVETGRHVARLHLTFDARNVHRVDQLAPCLRLLSSIVHFKLLVITSQRGTDVPAQRLTEIYQALRERSTRLETLELRASDDSIDFLAPGLTELLRQNTSLRAVKVFMQQSLADRLMVRDNFCAALADLTEIRVVHLETAVLSGLGQCRPQWPFLSYAAFEFGFENSAVELDLILYSSRDSLRAIVISEFSRNVRGAEASGPLHFHQLETAVVTTTEAFSLFRQLVHVSSPVHDLYITEVTPESVQAVKAFYDDKPTKTLTRLVVPTGLSVLAVIDEDSFWALCDWAGPREIEVIQADEDAFCDALQRRAWQGW